MSGGGKGIAILGIVIAILVGIIIPVYYGSIEPNQADIKYYFEPPERFYPTLCGAVSIWNDDTDGTSYGFYDLSIYSDDFKFQDLSFESTNRSEHSICFVKRINDQPHIINFCASVEDGHPQDVSFTIEFKWQNYKDISNPHWQKIVVLSFMFSEKSFADSKVMHYNYTWNGNEYVLQK